MGSKYLRLKRNPPHFDTYLKAYVFEVFWIIVDQKIVTSAIARKKKYKEIFWTKL